MAKVDLYNMQGSVCGEIELNDSVFGVPLHEDLLSRSVLFHLERCRQGTHKTKGRSEVSGGGRKPYRQKGTGRARQGSIRSAQHVGGGVIHGKEPLKYGSRMNKKMRALAMKSALSSLVNDEKLMVLDSLKLDEGKTKKMVKVLAALKVDKGALLVTETPEKEVIRASGNIPAVKTAIYNTFNVYDLLKYDKVIMTQDAIKKIEEVYA